MRTPSALATVVSVTSVIFEFPSEFALAFDASARVEVAHALWVADLLDVVDRDVEFVGELAGTLVAAGAAPGPFAVGGHQHHRHLGDGGLGFDEGLDAVVFGDPLLQVLEVGRGVWTGGAALGAASTERIEQSQLD